MTIRALLLILMFLSRNALGADEIGDLINSTVAPGLRNLNSPKDCNEPKPRAPARSDCAAGKDLGDGAMSLEDARKIHSSLRSQVSRYALKGDYVADRVCAARAALIAEDLKETCKLKSEKIFVKPSMLGSLKVEVDGQKFRWDKFHVANVVKITKNGKTEDYVFDPLLFKEPVPLKTWEDTVKKSNPSASSTRTPSNVYVEGGPVGDERALGRQADQDIQRAKTDARLRTRY